MKGSNKASLRTRIKNRYLLIIRREETLEERFTLVLTPINVILLFSVVFVAFFILTVALFFYSPLKEYVPGYRALNDPEEQIVLLQRIDSLEQSLEAMRLKARSVENILKGQPELNETDMDSAQQSPGVSQSNPYQKNEEALIQEVEAEQENGVNPMLTGNRTLPHAVHFLQPLRGLVTDTFNAGNGHYAIDIVSRRNSAVKATLDGTVVFSGWTPETGHMIILQHKENWLSVYKHNSTNFKKEGNFVNAGEAIAMVGNSGEYSSGPHLHFELWHSGVPMDPKDYLYK